jgi:hypothetical protein
MSERVTQSELARLTGIARTVINRYVTKGVLELDQNGLIDLDTAIEALKTDPALNSRPQRTERPPTAIMQQITGGDSADDEDEETAAAPPTSYQRARAKREYFMALQAQQKYELDAGNLLDKQGTIRAATAILAALTQALDKVPDRATAELPDEYHHETRLSIRREIDHALQAARKVLQKQIPDAPA